MEDLSDSFLNHITKAKSQYDDMCRALAAEVIKLRAANIAAMERFIGIGTANGELGELSVGLLVDKTLTAELIARVVTGDGQQLENLNMRDDDWRAQMVAEGVDVVEATIALDDWLALLKVARQELHEHRAIVGGEFVNAALLADAWRKALPADLLRDVVEACRQAASPAGDTP